MKSKTKHNLDLWFILFVAIIGGLGIVIVWYNIVDTDNQCLAERLCWDNGYEFKGSTPPNTVFCYEINEKGDNILQEFVNVNWTELDNRYVCG